VVKNKMAPPFQECEFDIIYNKGISFAGEVLDLAVQGGLIRKSGAWYSFGDERIGQGRDNAVGFITDHPDLLKGLTDQILEIKGIPPRPVLVDSTNASEPDA